MINSVSHLEVSRLQIVFFKKGSLRFNQRFMRYLYTYLNNVAFTGN